MESKRYLINASCSVATRVLQLSILVWVNQYLLRRISTEEYSLLPLVMSLLIFGRLFKDAFVSGVGRFIVEADAKGEKEEITRIVSSVLPYFFGLAAFLTLLGGGGVYFLGALVDIDPAYLPLGQLMLGLLLLPLVLGILCSPFSIGLYVRQRFVWISGIELGCELLRIGVVLALLFGVSTSVLWLVIGSVISALLSLMIRVIYTVRQFPEIRFRLSTFSRASAQKLFRFSAWTSVGSLSNLASNTIPILLLGNFGTALDMAAYHLGRLPDVNIRRMALAAVMPIQPALTSVYAKEGHSALKEAYFRGGRYHLWITLPLVAPLVVFAAPIMTLYAGEQYLQAASIMSAFLLMYPFIWASAMFYRVAHAGGIVGAYYRYEILTAVLSIIGAVILVAGFHMGGYGVALGAAGAGILTHLTVIWRKGLQAVDGEWSRFRKETLGPGLWPFATALVVAMMFKWTLSLSEWSMILLGTLLALTAYSGVLLRFCLGPEDKELLQKAIRRLSKILPIRHHSL